ncbi:proline--tRNA ligase [Prescottella equi]|uniref:proline--tRNA ligase n=1 Tax=Rhodococcus hoagii TaxID=43767 RepID=UPI000A117217|nr:proline--tRNA ligase [Prescottella equi]NKR26054.1 proline--tRNA ligase [Prescottella equi]NKR39691.1 proline--tRNA ligase [Prescottella equi]NKR60882.1 proline--tRNA ligase [Prescottella equi]NKR68394.1 proline--tRNA ligase [Prescottella equi]NKR72513.1 proline--tRNA ligase [Prescottella equi]
MTGSSQKAAVLTSQDEDFPRWYQDVLNKAELADNGPVRGTMVIRPYAYALWEHMQAAVDKRIKAAGAENVYLPLLIPQSYLEREAEHVEGFSPELAVVTHAGGKDLTEPAVVRPTSETVFGELMAKWIQSHRDLPMRLNQWANVVRWEMRPRIFLRTSEFLWQEGHTAHATRDEASAFTRQIHLDVYRDFLQSMLGIPVLVGVKTAREKFAGAVTTMTCEAMMGDGKALQMATSHELGQNFAKAFDISYTDASGRSQLCWTTSWGSSTRMIGGLIMAHGDDHGLRLPPRVAPVQVAVIAVKDDERTVTAASALTEALVTAGVRARLDARIDQGFGRRATEWELKGVPLRVEVGPRDLERGEFTVARRDTRRKFTVTHESAVTTMRKLLDEIHAEMFAAADDRLGQRMTDVDTVDEAVDASTTGFARIPWKALGERGERQLNTHAVTVRCLQTADGTLPDGATPEDELVAIVGRSY